VAGDQPRDFPNARNILEAITSRHPIPFIVGVMRQDLGRVWLPEDVAAYFSLPMAQVLGLNATEPGSAVQALVRLLSIARGSDWDGRSWSLGGHIQPIHQETAGAVALAGR
jgi:signal recognition particle receptor subunit beta